MKYTPNVRKNLMLGGVFFIVIISLLLHIINYKTNIGGNMPYPDRELLARIIQCEAGGEGDNRHESCSYCNNE